MEAEVKAAAIGNGTEDQFKLAEAPLMPGAPSKPRRAGIVIIGLMGATIFALMATLGATVLDGTVRGTRDVQTLLAMSPIGIVPYIRNAQFHRRRRRQLAALAASVLVALPASYYVLRMFAS
jgi:predicted permease